MSFLTEYFNLTEEEGEQPVCCPFPHKTSSGLEYLETRPSAHVNTDKQLFHCKVCNKGYSEAQFITAILGCTYAEELKVKRCFNNYEDIVEWDKETSLSDATRKKLHAFNITDEVIDELHIVSSPDLRDDIVFPAFMFDHLCDIRTYRPGEKPKLIARAGAPSGLIIPFDIWRNTPTNRWTFICAGEKDMAVARSHGLNAITITGGEGAQPIPLNYFKDRLVGIFYDNDGAGIRGAQALARTLYKAGAKTIKIVTGFHEICKEEHEDITDYFNKYGQHKENLIEYLKNTEPYNPDTDEEFTVTYPKMNLMQASDAGNLGRMVQTNVQVVSTSEDTFVCPAAIVAEKIREGGLTDTLPVGTVKEWYLKEETLGDILHLIDNNFKEDQIHEHIKNIMHIMQKEKYVSIKTLSKVTVFKAYVTDMFETADDMSAQPMEYVVYSIGKKLESGQKYMITHKLVPHPYKGQQLVSIAIDFKQANDSVSDFKLNETTIEHLKTIQDIPGSVADKVHTMTEKVKGILGYNGNDQLIQAIDLSYNTVLGFNFGTFKNVRGYLDTFIISESRIGKSSTSNALRKTYGLGTITSLAGNSATIPGLVGGSNKTSTGYQTRAGVIPQNHKGLIIFEEFGKSSHQVSAELTDIRSSNEVRIARVSGTLTLPALVRMITLTNPKTTNGQIKSIASYPNGFTILTELVDTAEDIARYDMIVILADRGANAIDPLWQPEEPLPQEVYRTRIRWIWSRTPEQVILSPEVLNYIIAAANDINEKYECHIKLFGTEAWKKITRLAIAVAGYVVSTDETYENIVVTKECVDYAVQYLKNLYDNSTFKLKEYVEHEKLFSSIDDEGVARLQQIYETSPMLIIQLEQSASVTKNVLQAATGMSFEELSKSLNQLTKGLFIKFSGYDIIPTERFRLGVSRINKKTYLPKLGELNA